MAILQLSHIFVHTLRSRIGRRIRDISTQILHAADEFRHVLLECDQVSKLQLA